MIKKVIATFFVFVLCLTCIACGRPSGVYYSGDKASGTYNKYEFGISKISIERYIDGEMKDSIEGDYEIDGNQITIYYENEKGEEAAVTKYFEKIDDDSIKIDELICYCED